MNLIVLGLDIKDLNVGREFAYLNSERKILIPQFKRHNDYSYQQIITRIKSYL
jgi:hypothetical protein